MESDIPQHVCQRFLRAALAQAGPRYYPHVKQGFPSIPIDELLRLHDYLCRTKAWQDEVASIKGLIDRHLKEIAFVGVPKQHLTELQTLADEAREAVQSLRRLFRKTNTSHSVSFWPIPLSEIAKANTSLFVAVARAREKVEVLRKNLTSSVPTQVPADKLERLSSQLSDLLKTTSRIRGFSKGAVAASSNYRVALLRGAGGTGKTHFFCDLAKSRIDTGQPTIIVLTQMLSPFRGDIIGAIIQSQKLAGSKKAFLRALNKQARRTGQRALLLIDAMNETNDRQAWKKALNRCIEELKPYRGIALLLSVRSQFETLVVSHRVLQALPTIEHHGFAGLEAEVQAAMFNWFKLPLPEVPLLASEFSNPLFLRVYCEVMHKAINSPNGHRRIKRIASSLEGMTYVLEQFIEQVQEQIDTKLRKAGLPPGPHAWLWGSKATDGLIKSMALAMVKNESDRITASEFLALVAKTFPNRTAASFIVRELISGGIVREEVSYSTDARHEYVAFAHQKFSDHLIVRTLLKDRENAASNVSKLIRRSTPEPGLIEALMIEYPRRFPQREVLELFAPDELQRWHLRAFASGLCWRHHDDFNSQTKQYVRMALAEEADEYWATDALVTLAIKAGHRLGGDELCTYLSMLTMPDRDIRWSEYLRTREHGGTVNRILAWVLQYAEPRDPAVVHSFIRVLKWILTSTDKSLRDQSIRALVILGEVSPELLLQETLDSLQINDPYVLEGMLAAANGVCMRLRGKRQARHFMKDTLPAFARALYKKVFARRADFGTTHALIRDHACNVITIALQSNRQLLTREQCGRLRPPYRDGGIRRWRQIDDHDGHGKYSAMHSDFRTYTLSHLSPHTSRKGWSVLAKMTPRQIAWRMKMLGYTHERFGEIDRAISRSNSYSRKDWTKVERYGKKYSWIAYFELYGLRQDQGIIRRSGDQQTRPSDCGVDPSFPTRPQKFAFFQTDLLERKTHSVEKWLAKNHIDTISRYLIRKEVLEVEGRWVMLHGYVNQQDQTSKRDASIVVSAVLVADANFREFVSHLNHRRLRSHDFTRSEHSNYIFAGEIPWSDKWNCDERQTAHAILSKRTKTVMGHETQWFQNGRPIDFDAVYRLFDGLKSRKDGLPHSSQLRRAIRENGITWRSHRVRETKKETVTKAVHFELAFSDLLWESHHSAENEDYNIKVPARGILRFARLAHSKLDWSFFDRSDQHGAICVEAGERHGNRQDAVFVREDILSKYLERRKQTLVWVLWAERQVVLGWDGPNPDVTANTRPITEHHAYRVYKGRDART